MFSLELFNPLNDFNSVKAQLDVKIPFKVYISNVVDDLTVYTDLL